MTSVLFKAWRKRLAITQTQAARLLCAHQTDVARWETGAVPIHPRVARLCRLLAFPAVRKQVERDIEAGIAYTVAGIGSEEVGA